MGSQLHIGRWPLTLIQFIRPFWVPTHPQIFCQGFIPLAFDLKSNPQGSGEGQPPLVPDVRPTSGGESSEAPGTKPGLMEPWDQATPLLAHQFSVRVLFP